LRKLLVPLLAVGLLGPAAAPALAATTNVKIGDNYFVRPSGVPKIKIAKGDKVRWQWKGESLHNVKVSSGPVRFGSPSKMSGSYTRAFTRKGTYTLICTVHGARDQSMKLVVR